MKRILYTAILAAAVAAAAAQNAGVRDTQDDLTRDIHIASIYAGDVGLRHYVGQRLWSTNGANLGEVRDFLVAVPAGSIEYAVISTGGFLGGMGNSLRLVPFSALQQTDENPARITVNISQTAWLQIPPISDEDYVTDRFQFSAERHEQLAAPFGASVRRSLATSSSPSPERSFSGLVRAMTLKGLDVHAGGQPIGEIENVVFDFARGTAAALFDAEGSFTGTNAKYLVPLNRFAFQQPRSKAIAAQLTRADFERARPTNFGMPAGVAALSENEPAPAPTGRTDTSSGRR